MTEADRIVIDIICFVIGSFFVFLLFWSKKAVEISARISIWYLKLLGFQAEIKPTKRAEWVIRGLSIFYLLAIISALVGVHGG